MDAEDEGSRRPRVKIPPKSAPGFPLFLALVGWILVVNKAEFAVGESCGKKVIYKTVNTRMELLTSPSYPQDYENNEHCQWVLTTPASSQVVQIESVASDIVNWDGDKCEDYIAVFDGLDSTKPQLRRWCGSEQAVVKSTGSSVLVVFHTDQHLTGRGFALKYYAMDEYSSKCDPDRIVQLETSFNPLFLDLPSYTAPKTPRGEVVTCRYLLTTTQDDASQVIRLETYTAIRCDEGIIAVYDGPTDKSPQILEWCHETEPFEAIMTSGRHTLITFTLQRSNSDWHLMRIRARSRSKTTGCSESNIPTIEIMEEAIFFSFPHTTSVQGNKPCSLRLWAKGRTQTLRLELVNSTKTGIECGDRGITFYDGYDKNNNRQIWDACKDSVVHSSTHNLLISPGKSYPMNKNVTMRVVALDYPCNNDTQKLKADNDAVQTVPSLSKNVTAYPNNAQCRYLMVAARGTDVVEVDVQGRMTPSRAGACGGDYITFYDGETSYAPVLGRWCGVQKRQQLTSSGPNMLVVVTSDDHDNVAEGFSLQYYAVPAKGKCPRRTNLIVNSTVQRLTSPNYPFYYPINAYCEWLLSASEGHVVVINVVNSEMEGDCSDMVRVYDGSDTKLDPSLGRWCGTERPRFKSTGRHMLLIFTADDRWNTGGFELEFFIHTAESTIPAWGICLAVILPILFIAAGVIVVVIYFRYWRREQRKL